MAYKDEKVAINLRDGEEHGALIETGEDGKERAYYLRQFAIHWNCERLQVRQRFDYRDKSDQGPPTILTYVTGVARLVSDHNVSVIGEPESWTKTVEMVFEPDDSPDLLKGSETGREEPWYRPSGVYGTAQMGFIRADRERRSRDEWWLECRLHSAALQPLIDAVSAGTLKQANLHVWLDNLFTDEHPSVPFLSREHLFLRPDKRDNTINSPESAHGWLERLSLGLSTVDIAPPPEFDLDDQQDGHQTVVQTATLQPGIQGSPVMASHIEALRRTVKWVGGLIAVALFLLLLK